MVKPVRSWAPPLGSSSQAWTEWKLERDETYAMMRRQRYLQLAAAFVVAAIAIALAVWVMLHV